MLNNRPTTPAIQQQLFYGVYYKHKHKHNQFLFPPNHDFEYLKKPVTKKTGGVGYQTQTRYTRPDMYTIHSVILVYNFQPLDPHLNTSFEGQAVYVWTVHMYRVYL